MQGGLPDESYAVHGAEQPLLAVLDALPRLEVALRFAKRVVTST
jgi:hypothetical protein